MHSVRAKKKFLRLPHQLLALISPCPPFVFLTEHTRNKANRQQFPTERPKRWTFSRKLRNLCTCSFRRFSECSSAFQRAYFAHTICVIFDTIGSTGKMLERETSFFSILTAIQTTQLRSQTAHA